VGSPPLVIRIVDVLRARRVSCLEVIANPHALTLYRQLGFVDVGETNTEFGTAPRMAVLIQ
jgi:hypothetical protein